MPKALPKIYEPSEDEENDEVPAHPAKKQKVPSFLPFYWFLIPARQSLLVKEQNPIMGRQKTLRRPDHPKKVCATIVYCFF
jgi:hypothetical protein